MKLKDVIKNSKPFAEPFCVTDGKSFRLKQVDPGDTLDLKSEDKPRAKEALAIGVQALAELQDMLYAQDRWALNNRLTVTLGVRMDYQAVGYGDAIRKPVITDVLPDGSRIFPTSTNVAAHTFFSNTNIAPPV